MLFGCFFNSHFVFVSGKHISFLNACAFGFAVINYEGRYRDKHSLEATVELRQHVWKRNGIVVWVGAGTIFPKFSALRSKQILPNAGVGYRWEFKKNVNVRLDYGFGKSGQSGFLFNINEAF